MPRKKRSGVSTSPTQRQLRVGELVRHALAELFVDNPVRDSALEGVAITVLEVSVNRDLSVAKVFVLPLAGEREETVVAALERHRKFIRGRLARLVILRHIPELRFELDTTFNTFGKINQLLTSDAVRRDLDRDESD